MSRARRPDRTSRRACLTRWLAAAGLWAVWPTYVRAQATAAVPVVASFSLLADWVRQVGGPRVQVESLVGPLGDAHVFQPSPAHARRLASARLVLAHGLGYEGWLERLLRNAAYRGAVVRVADGLPDPLPAAATPGHRGHDHGDLDPHTWQDVRNVMHAVRRIEEALCAADPPGCGDYRERAAQYQRQLQALDEEIRAAWAAIPPAQRKVVTSHQAFRYYGRAYGVTFLGAQGVSTASEPSAAAVGRLIRQIRAEGVRAVFVERLSDPRLVQRIAEEAGVRPSSVPLYSDALSGPEGPAADYLSLMRHNTRAMVQAIAGS